MMPNMTKQAPQPPPPCEPLTQLGLLVDSTRLLSRLWGVHGYVLVTVKYRSLQFMQFSIWGTAKNILHMFISVDVVSNTRMPWNLIAILNLIGLLMRIIIKTSTLLFVCIRCGTILFNPSCGSLLSMCIMSLINIETCLAFNIFGCNCLWYCGMQHKKSTLFPFNLGFSWCWYQFFMQITCSCF